MSIIPHLSPSSSRPVTANDTHASRRKNKRKGKKKKPSYAPVTLKKIELRFDRSGHRLPPLEMGNKASTLLIQVERGL